MPKSFSKNLAFSLVLVLIVAAVFELGAFSLSLATKDFYGQKRHVVARLEDRESDYAEFLETTYDGLTGWRNQPAHSHTEQNCDGQPYVLAHDALGARRGPDAPMQPDAVRIVAVGDSFTYGVDRDFADAYPTRLAELTGVGVANQGVGGYGPLQALLRFEQVAAAYPRAQIAILGIMHENINRLPNAYRSALYRSSRFGFKPYAEITADGPRIRPNPNGPEPKSFDDLRAMAATAFDRDYWWKAEANFPYMLSFIRNLASNDFRIRKLDRLLSLFGADELTLEYQNDELTSALALVIERFVSAAETRGMRPVVAFIPQTRHDRQVSAPFMEEQQKRLGDRALFIGVGRAEMDWSAYRNRVECHPTPQGYRTIAKAIYDALRDHSWLPGRDAAVN